MSCREKAIFFGLQDVLDELNANLSDCDLPGVCDESDDDDSYIPDGNGNLNQQPYVPVVENTSSESSSNESSDDDGALIIFQ